jgi:type II secretory pathway pseudopilin PulG
MVEMLIAIVILTIALSAMIVVFSTGIITIRQAGQRGTAQALADAQMETYRAMTSRDIGLNLSTATVTALDTTYKSDAACVNGASTCNAAGVATVETAPTGTGPVTCISSPTSVNTWYSDTLPCTPSRTVTPSTTPASPDHRSYRVDTYIVKLAASGTLLGRKQVTVVVRDGSSLSALVRETSIFDCSTGATPNSTDC